MSRGAQCRSFCVGLAGRERHPPGRTGKLAQCSGIGLEASPHIVDGFFRHPAPVRVRVGSDAVQRIAELARAEQAAQKSKALVQRVRRPAWVGRHAHGRGRAQLHEQGHALLGNVFQHEPVVAAIRDFARAYFQRSATGDFTCRIARHQSQPPGVQAGGDAAAVC